MSRKASTWQRLKAGIRRAVLNYLEAGQRWTRGRSYIPGEIRDARFDVSSAERLEVVRKSRYFEANNALANRICDLFELYTVGPNGLQVTPASVDEVWNEKRQRAWNAWCQFPDISSRQSFGTLQGLIARRLFFDGEVFILKTQGRPQLDKTGRAIGPARPRVQLIETHRVATPPSMAVNEGRTIIDGIEVDSNGRPVRYWVRDAQTGLFEEASYKPIDADSIIHVIEPSRTGQYRGLPLLHAVINDLHDLDDLQMFEMQAAKQNSQVTRTIKTESGELEDGDVEAVPFLTKAKSTDETEVTREKYYHQVFGAEVHVLKHGDSYEQFASQRPSVAVQQYWEYLITKICAGVGIDKQLVYPASMQGTVTRGVYDISDAFFRARSSIIADAVMAIYEWQCEWDVNNSPELRDKPFDWQRATTCPPRAVNVDIGKNTTAQLALLEAGATTLEDIYAPHGKNWRERSRQRAREIAVLKFEAQMASQLYPGIEVTAGEISKSLVVETAQPQPQEPVTA